MTAVAAPRLRRPGRGLLRDDRALAVAGGLVCALASPPFDVVPAVFVGLAVLATVALRAPTVRRAFVLGLLWATVGGIVGMRFVPAVLDRYVDGGTALGVVALVLLALAQAVAWGLAAALARVLARTLPGPLAFGLGVAVASFVPGLFTWTPAALLMPRPELLQLAEVVGERGTSLVIGVLAALLATRRPRPVVAALVVLVALDLGGAARMDAIAARPGETLRVALVDHAATHRVDPTPAQRRVELARLHALSRQADARGAELVVWPEGAFPYPLARPLGTLAPGDRSPLTPGARAPRLVGVRTYEDAGGGRRRFNSATLVQPDGHAEPPYDKVELMWFGETMGPLNGVLPAGRTLTAGDAPAPVLLSRTRGGRLETLRLAILTCYEDMQTAYGRRVGHDVRPALLTGMSNNSWFAGTVATDWQERLSTMRAIELRTDLVRAVNGGVSSWVDASGRARLRHESPQPSVRLVTPKLRGADAEPTLYARLGDLPLLILCAASIVIAAARRRGYFLFAPGN